MTFDSKNWKSDIERTEEAENVESMDILCQWKKAPSCVLQTPVSSYLKTT